ncbi:hypothetical protein CN378_01340 [Bacillus sp. AFS015802]|nr:hypothetical protein CN378_01340 [Bacillus sp. AFS015802]
MLSLLESEAKDDPDCLLSLNKDPYSSLWDMIHDLIRKKYLHLENPYTYNNAKDGCVFQEFFKIFYNSTLFPGFTEVNDRLRQKPAGKFAGIEGL